MYSTAVYGNIFEQFSEPEIKNVPLENIILQLKSIGIKDILKFPFPTMPNLKNFKIAFKSLLSLQALKYDEKYENDLLNNMNSDISQEKTQITELGKACSFIPISAKFAKMLLAARQQKCLGYAMLIAAGSSVEEIFSQEKEITVLSIKLKKNKILIFDVR